ncbi:MAG: lysophospholipid acyltransferase family protein [Spirochaetes bacterium]|nr:lysophospholipid acyltransferase family protein [Spirochaetota bacterium]
MIALTYKLITAFSKIVGPWLFQVISKLIAAGYFLFFPARTKISINFYKALFPERGKLYHMYCSLRQFMSFTNVFVDRFILESFDDIEYTSEGLEYIEEAVNSKKGAILLMSHIGNWEVAAHLLKRKNVKMLLYMGIKEKEEIEKKQKESLKRNELKIIAVPENQASPFDIIEGINFLKEGGIISLTGDRIWRQDQRAIKVNFLDHKVMLPETPYIFALLSGAPLLTFFAFRTGRKHYHFRIASVKHIKSAGRKDRKEVLQQAAQDYADMMENTVRKYPHEWFHFEPFLGEKISS